MFKMYQELREQLRQKCPELLYIHWDRGQFDKPDSGIIPPALLLNISINWEGKNGEAVVAAKLWVMTYEDAATEDETKAYALSENVISNLRGLSGAHFNSLQQTSEALLPEYRGLAVNATFRCNIRTAS